MSIKCSQWKLIIVLTQNRFDMDARNKRIEAFINSLETVEEDGHQSILLSSDMSILGGGGTTTNKEECRNSAGCGNAVNELGCTNYDKACDGSVNAKRCETVPKKDDTIQPLPVTNPLNCVH